MTMDYTNIPTDACHLGSPLTADEIRQAISSPVIEKSNPHVTLPLDGEGKRWGCNHVGIRLHRIQSVCIYWCKETVQKRR